MHSIIMFQEHDIGRDISRTVIFFNYYYSSHGSRFFPGLLLEAQFLHKEALMAFSFALSIDPDYVPSMVCMAGILRNIGGNSLSIARTYLRNALRLEPTNHRAWLSLGLVLKAEGSLQEAADCFQAAYELRELSPIQDFSEQLPIMLH